MSAQPLRKNRNFVLLQSGQLLSTLGNQTALWATPSPSIRKAPSLSELES